MKMQFPKTTLNTDILKSVMLNMKKQVCLHLFPTEVEIAFPKLLSGVDLTLSGCVDYKNLERFVPSMNLNIFILYFAISVDMLLFNTLIWCIPKSNTS